MTIIPWSSENDTYKLSDEVSLQKADKAEWGVFCSIYYSAEYNGFFKEGVYDFQLRRDPFWIYQGDRKIGGVVIAPNVLYFLFLIPPFNDGSKVVNLLKRALLQWSELSNPIRAYEVLGNQADWFARAGFWPDEFRCRWMQRPTESFIVEWDADYDVVEPEMEVQDLEKKTLKNMDEIVQFLHAAHEGSIDAVRRGQETLDSTMDWVSSYPYETNELLQKASSLVYDRGTMKLVGACLISDQGGLPAIFGIAVLPEFSGKGLATRMIKKVLTALKAHYPILRLYVMQGNSAESVYYNLGFMPGPLEVQKFTLSPR